MLTEITTRAEAALSAALGRPVGLGSPRLLKDATRSLIVRLEARGEAPPWPSVIAKLFRDDPATGFAEWASLALLAALPGAAGVAPRLLAGDVGARLLVMEDLGAGEELHAVLERGAPGQVAAALEAMARQMARLHGATAGVEETFLALRAALPAGPGPRRTDEAAAWLAAQGRARAWLAALGRPEPAGLDACLGRVAGAYAEPGPWLSFSHGDPAPSNCYLAGGAARLVDFEYGAFRHSLYDLSAWHVLCPLPPPAVERLLRAFRQALAPALPVAADDAAFAEAWATLCAYRALAMLTWVSPAALAEDRPFVGAWTARRAVLAAASRLAAAAAPVAALGPVAALAASLEGALAERWPELGPPAALTPFPRALP